MEADFSGYATKAGLRCADGRTIMPHAFKHQDKMQVPLVWQHGHTNPENVLGHMILENREDGVYGHGFFNDSDQAKHAKGLLDHKDIKHLSIWANELVERAGRVLHGTIREVSLVLSGANPGALIETVTIRHSDGDVDTLEDEAIIYTDDEIEISHSEDNNDNNDDNLEHADDTTVEQIFNTMSQEQQNVLYYMVGQALESAGGGNLQQDNLDDNTNDDQKGKDMTNVFETDSKPKSPVLSHSDMKAILEDGVKLGSLKEAVEAYAIQHGVDQIDTLFPDAKPMTASPEFWTRRTEWVQGVIGGAHKTPFSRVKTHWADLTYEAARAKGYITGALKKEEYFATARRETMPQTIYKKQALDRDDIIDITDFDVVAWMKGEMRLMFDEELARAALLGDGREADDEDKIKEDRIRPIVSDDPLFTIQVLADVAGDGIQAFVDAVVSSRSQWRGTGLPAMYTTETIIAKFLLLRDTLGRRIYKNLAEVADELRVSAIIPCELMEDDEDLYAILVNMTDYTFGADKGGEVTLFDDFDIDYNKYKYLMESRCSGALTKLKSAMVVRQGEFESLGSATPHVIDPEPPHNRQSDPPVHGSLPDAEDDE